MILEITDVFPEAHNRSWLEGFERECRFAWEKEKADYMARQQRAQQEIRETPIKNIDGLGQLIGVFDARTYFRWQEEDPWFWDDRQNVERFLQDNPECRAPKPVTKQFGLYNG